MRVFHGSGGGPGDVPAGFGPSGVAIGNFDGVHVGHLEILRRVVELASETGCVPTVLTFHPHPARILAPDRAPKLIVTLEQRLRLFEAAGIAATLVQPFSTHLAALTPREFCNGILIGALGAQCVMVGEDFRFGVRQTGDVDTLRSFGIEVRPVEEIGLAGVRASSTAIRRLVEEGRVSRARRMLGRPFALEGPVVHGRGIGRTLTVPTLNLASENELLPATGVYVTRTRDEATDREWASITNVGYRPTFGDGGLTVETYLLDSPPAEAPERIEVQFLARVRGERKFESPEALKAQILRDAGAAQRFHRRAGRSMAPRKAQVHPP